MSSDRLELNGIAAGVYVVRATQGETVCEEQLVVQDDYTLNNIIRANRDTGR
jgi:hypothetical protein